MIKVFVIIQLNSLDFKENSDAGNIINDGVIFFPFLGCGPHDGVAGLLGAVLYVERPHDSRDVLVAQELPHAIRGDHDELVA